MKTPAWSFSSLKTFEQCPRKFEAEKVTKEVPYTQSEAALYGEQLHKAAEEYVRDGPEIDPRFKFIKPYLDRLIAIPGEKLCELKMGIKKQDGRLVACDFFDRDVWFRGVADLVILNGDVAYITDYKTSKNSRYADMRQLKLMAAAVFLRYPQIKKIKMSLIFIVCRDFVKDTVEREFGLDIFADLAELLTALNTAYETNVWNPKPNGLCRQWCGVKDCPHNGG